MYIYIYIHFFNACGSPASNILIIPMFCCILRCRTALLHCDLALHQSLPDLHRILLRTVLNLTWLCTEASQTFCGTFSGTLLNLTCTKASPTFSGTFSGTLLNLTWLCTKAFRNFLRNLLRNPVEPDLALPLMILLPPGQPSGPADQRISGPAELRISGSADQRISGPADQRISGPADQRTSGPADQRISGSADQRISASADQRISGPANQRTSGAAVQRISGPADQRISGSTDYSRSGDQRANGSADQRISGPVDQRISGPADLQISRAWAASAELIIFRCPMPYFPWYQLGYGISVGE